MKEEERNKIKLNMTDCSFLSFFSFFLSFIQAFTTVRRQSANEIKKKKRNFFSQIFTKCSLLTTDSVKKRRRRKETNSNCLHLTD